MRTAVQPRGKLSASVLLLSLGIATIASSRAATIYSSGVDGTNLVTIDTVSGAGTVIGPFGYSGAYGTAFDPTGNLYTIVDSYGTAALATVNKSTGAATPVGASTNIADLMVMEFAPDGTLFAGSWGNNNLYKLNLATGAATLVGSSLPNMMDFAFNPAGVMYATDASGLYTINPITGAYSFVVALSGTDGGNMGIAFDAAGNLFGTSWNSTNSPLWNINLITGAATQVGLTGIAKLHGGDIAAIPEPMASALFSALAIGIAACARRRFGRS